MIESNYRELFSETVTLYPPASTDVYGKRTFSASGTAFPAHLVAETKQVTTPDGREVVQTGKAYLYGTSNATTDYLIVLDDSSSPIIIAVDTPYDPNGAHHSVIAFGM